MGITTYDEFISENQEKMFRLSKGNQSRKNHKIIHQTTKVSEADAPLSTPAQEAQRHAQELMKQQQLEQEAAKQAAESQKQAETVTEKIINETVSQKLVNSQVHFFSLKKGKFLKGKNHSDSGGKATTRPTISRHGELYTQNARVHGVYEGVGGAQRQVGA